MKKRFILTQDEKTAELLKENGFTFVKKEGKTYAYINDGKLTFSSEGRKIVYTNLLSV